MFTPALVFSAVSSGLIPQLWCSLLILCLFAISKIHVFLVLRNKEKILLLMHVWGSELFIWWGFIFMGPVIWSSHPCSDGLTADNVPTSSKIWIAKCWLSQLFGGNWWRGCGFSNPRYYLHIPSVLGPIESTTGANKSESHMYGIGKFATFLESESPKLWPWEKFLRLLNEAHL